MAGKGSDVNKNKLHSYEVGYKKPPGHTQFKPGQSGNVKGRPKRSQTFNDVVLKHLRKTVRLAVGGKSRRISLLEAIVLKHVSKATNGDPKSTSLLLGVFRADEGDQGNHLPQLLQQFRAIYAAHGVEGRDPALSPDVE
jgi:hypothetical protein